MRLIRLALAIAAVSISWAANANPAVNSSVSGSIAGTVGASVGGAVGPTAATTQMVAGQAQVRIDGASLGGNLGNNLGNKLSGNDVRATTTGSSTNGWLMALVAVLLIGHQLRRKHRFLRPQRFSDL